MIRAFIATIILCSAFSCPAQNINLVPNPSFEDYSAPPLGWFYKGSHFTRLVSKWSSPSLASPDAFGPKIIVPQHWKDKGFGEISPVDGEGYIGITTFGCKKGKPHCREYIQVKLLQPLTVGATYELKFWVAHLTKSLKIDQIGVALKLNPTLYPDDRLLSFSPLVTFPEILKVDDNWNEVTYQFIAESPYEFLIIGNFVSDEKTATVTDCEDVFPYAYYYIDAVSIHEIKKPQNPFTEKTYTKGDKIILKNILFDTDKATLRPTSFEQLDQLVEYLQKNQTFNVKIIGHTDNVGGLEYNLDLSNRRSKSVIDYLIAAGIPADRLAYEGLGATQPIADNLVAEGRAKNRRVELNLF